jgi:enoyl-CoA hydratase/carnithine racemase
MADYVRIEKHGPVGIVTIARPERRNALNLAKRSATYQGR